MAAKSGHKCKGIDPFDIAADSHVGLVRENNEDSYGYSVLSEKHNAIVAVADGIGGHENGDLASRLCIRQLLTSWRYHRLFDKASEAQAKKFLDEHVRTANDFIYQLNDEHGLQHPMGTTLVSAVFLQSSVVVAHAGDSRCYRIRNGIVERLTQDHSFVAELVRKNVINAFEAQHHPFAHIISRSVGPTADLEVEIKTYDRRAGDRYIFCSDGLTNHVEDPEIEMIVYDATNPYDAVKELLNAALRGGGDDNITVVCVFS